MVGFLFVSFIGQCAGEVKSHDQTRHRRDGDRLQL